MLQTNPELTNLPTQFLQPHNYRKEKFLILLINCLMAIIFPLAGLFLYFRKKKLK
jgi:hypothetical protein